MEEKQQQKDQNKKYYEQKLKAYIKTIVIHTLGYDSTQFVQKSAIQYEQSQNLLGKILSKLNFVNSKKIVTLSYLISCLSLYALYKIKKVQKYTLLEKLAYKENPQNNNNQNQRNNYQQITLDFKKIAKKSVETLGYSFLHFDFPHLLFNLHGFYQIASQIERLKGSKTLFKILLSGIVGTILGFKAYNKYKKQNNNNEEQNNTQYYYGSSGLFYCLFGYYLMMQGLFSGIKSNLIPMALIIAQEIQNKNGFTSSGHLGGLLMGMLFYIISNGKNKQNLQNIFSLALFSNSTNQDNRQLQIELL